MKSAGTGRLPFALLLVDSGKTGLGTLTEEVDSHWYGSYTYRCVYLLIDLMVSVDDRICDTSG